uniref:Uncharacterized protein n=1 Tax=Haptolina ericina TaxID=156174 RepID=A0A7S3AV61_9EUKA|mmetsp:Transcript_3754/g.8165  ORF Transcript_3754/g.8165 Transcript_3754/m.8165 type:complete len:160 (+) Transcript_3754:715-1194(+)
MTALQNGTGDGAMRQAFVSQLLRGANRKYMLQKWGAIKPSRPEEAETRWRTPFNRQLPLKWWVLDTARRDCIRAPAPPPPHRAHLEAPCPFDERLAAQGEKAALQAAQPATQHVLPAAERRGDAGAAGRPRPSFGERLAAHGRGRPPPQHIDHTGRDEL